MKPKIITIEDVFKTEGFLAELNPQYEYRQSQEEMAAFIEEALVEEQNCLVEAGTGVGKTLAYLVAAVLYAIYHDKVVAISTETKALQAQLLNKDLPLLKKILAKHLNFNLKSSLCLGSSNYLCRARLERLIMRGSALPEWENSLKEVIAKVKAEEIFSLADLNIPTDLWKEICREPDSCFTSHCPYVNDCTFLEVKKEWAASQLLVMNHHLFFSNIKTDRSFLPPFQVVIFDEAHSVENIAISQLGFELHYDELAELLATCYKPKRRGHLVTKIADRQLANEVKSLVTQIQKDLSVFFSSLNEQLAVEQQTAYLQRDLTESGQLLANMKELRLLMKVAKESLNEDYSADIDTFLSKFSYAYFNLSTALTSEDENYVFWLEHEKATLFNSVFLIGQPIDVSQIMQEQVNNFYESSIFTSATLAVGDKFTNTIEALGLTNFQAQVFASPFDYQKQALLYIPQQMPEPHEPQYLDFLVGQIVQLTELLGGNILILFTSYKTLNLVHQALAELLDNCLISQSDYRADEALKKYLQTEDSILLGTHSFWQGIDLPGDLLRCVVLTKFPFAVPTHPVVEAKIKKLNQAGKNPFFSYQIPQAVIKFKQGFGRLIRSQQDKGIVFICDSRITSKNYGKIFYRSLPTCQTITNFADLQKEWLKK